MVQVLEFVFSDVWHFIGSLCFVALFVMWKPIEVNVMNGYWKGKNENDAE